MIRGRGQGLIWTSAILITALCAAPINGAQTFDVRAFGATGDGRSDDTRAIQAAIDRASAAGSSSLINTVLIPRGTYRVTIDPSSKCALQMRPFIAIRGAGADRSVIQLGNNQGNYFAILSGRGRAVSFFSMTGVTIDSNARGNPVGSVSDFFAGDNVRFSLVAYAGSHIIIENNRFTDIDDINTVSLNVRGSDIWVTDNVFDNIGGRFDHDHSTIYVRGQSDVHVAGNTIRSRGVGVPAARTAIETHGSGIYVQNNTIENMYYGINVAAVDEVVSGVTITGNNIVNCLDGIWIWSMRLSDRPTALAEVVLSRNTIICDPNSWAPVITYNVARGIAIWKDSNAAVRSLHVLGNTIRYLPLNRPASPNDRWASGIDLAVPQSLQGMVSLDDIEILDNTIDSPPGAGVHIDANVSGLHLDRNSIVNFAQSREALSPTYRAGVFIEGRLTDAHVASNVFIDNQNAPSMRYGIVVNVSAAGSSSVSGNQIRVGAIPELVLVRTPSTNRVSSGSPITLTATVEGSTKPTQGVVFSDNGKVIATVPREPYSFTWSTVPRGVHLVRAEAIIQATPSGTVAYLPASPAAQGITDGGNSTAQWLVSRSGELCISATNPGESTSTSSLGIVNGASFDPGAPISPGSLVSIFGRHLVCSIAWADSVPLTRELGGHSVTFNGVAAPLLYVGVDTDSGASQINAQVPWQVLPADSTGAQVEVEVTNHGVQAGVSSIWVAPFSPGIFTFAAGLGQAAATNADGSAYAGPSRCAPAVRCVPAKPGDAIVIYATGLGAVDVTVRDGDVPDARLATTLANPTVLIGGAFAPVLFSGLSPQYVGVNQLNVVVPSGLAPQSAASLQIRMGPRTTSDRVTIAID